MDETKILKARAASFSKQYATNVLITETDSDVRLYSFNEIIETEEGRVAISENALIMTHQAAVLLYEQLKELMVKWNSEGRNTNVSEERRGVLNLLKDP